MNSLFKTIYIHVLTKTDMFKKARLKSPALSKEKKKKICSERNLSRLEVRECKHTQRLLAFQLLHIGFDKRVHKLASDDKRNFLSSDQHTESYTSIVFN